MRRHLWPIALLSLAAAFLTGPPAAAVPILDGLGRGLVPEYSGHPATPAPLPGRPVPANPQGGSAGSRAS